MTDEQISLYAAVRVQVPSGVRLRSRSERDPFPGGRIDAFSSEVIGVEGRYGDRVGRYMVRAETARTFPGPVAREVARSLRNTLGFPAR